MSSEMVSNPPQAKEAFGEFVPSLSLSFCLNKEMLFLFFLFLSFVLNSFMLLVEFDSVGCRLEEGLELILFLKRFFLCEICLLIALEKIKFCHIWF